jgi:hypothetical protein
VLDPITIGLAIKAMQGAFNGIQYCCEALSDGKVQVQKIKKAAEDAQAIVKEVKGIWSIVRGLFAKTAPKVEQPTTSSPNSERVYYARRVLSVQQSQFSLARTTATTFPVTFRLLPDASYSGSEYGKIIDRTWTA